MLCRSAVVVPVARALKIEKCQGNFRKFLCPSCMMIPVLRRISKQSQNKASLSSYIFLFVHSLLCVETLSLAFSINVASSALFTPICSFHQLHINTSKQGPPCQAISVEDITPTIKSVLQSSGMRNGVINIISRHTTTAITINERESRLARDMEKYFLSIAPPDERSSASGAEKGVRYFHNDIDQRPDNEEEARRCRENGWDIDDPNALAAWRLQEPINAHSHLLSMLLGSSESIPVMDGTMMIGQWQSILLVDFDGPRDRSVGVQLLGYL